MQYGCLSLQLQSQLQATSQPRQIRFHDRIRVSIHPFEDFNPDIGQRIG